MAKMRLVRSTEAPGGGSTDSASVAALGPDALLARVALGDEYAFAALYDATSDKVFGLVRRVVRDPRTADRRGLVAAVHVERSAGAAVARVAAGAGRRIAVEDAVDDREVGIQAAERAAVARAVVAKRAADDDRLAARLVHGHVLADLAEAAERNDPESVAHHSESTEARGGADREPIRR